jgi:hypothetical protein
MLSNQPRERPQRCVECWTQKHKHRLRVQAAAKQRIQDEKVQAQLLAWLSSHPVACIHFDGRRAGGQQRGQNQRKRLERCREILGWGYQ